MTIIRAEFPLLFFFNDTATTEIYTLSLHDALPISPGERAHERHRNYCRNATTGSTRIADRAGSATAAAATSRNTPAAESSTRDRKSTRLNSSHANISYAVFCLKKKKITDTVSSNHR